jgi:GTPase SAR1 family protein
MFDLGNRKSFEDVPLWKKDLDEKVRVKGKTIPSLLLGNKSDRPDRCATRDEIDRMSQNNGFINWIAISVKENKLVSQSMMRLVDILVTEDAENDAGDGNDSQCDGSMLNMKPDRHVGGQSTLQNCCANPQ